MPTVLTRKKRTKTHVGWIPRALGVASDRLSWTKSFVKIRRPKRSEKRINANLCRK